MAARLFAVQTAGALRNWYGPSAQRGPARPIYAIVMADVVLACDFVPPGDRGGQHECLDGGRDEVALPPGGGSYAMLTRSDRDLSPAGQAMVADLRAAARRDPSAGQP